jgi:hypothetical protein
MPGTTDTVKTILTPGEFVIRKEAVDMIGVPMLNMINNMPEKGGHSNIDRIIDMATMSNMKMMYGGGMVKPNYAGGGMVKQYGHGGMVKDKVMMMEKGGQLKPVPEDNPGLGKLPEMVRNRMGYMQEGGMVDDSLMGMRYGGMAKKKKMMGYQEGGIVDMVKGLLSRMPMKSESVEDIEQSGAPMVDMDAVLARKKMQDNAKFSIVPVVGEFKGKRIFQGSPEMKKYLDSDDHREYIRRKIRQAGPPQMTPFQDGGAVMLPPQPMDPLQIGARQADPSMYEGSQLGVRDQAMMLQDSIEQDTVNKARKTLQLMKLKGLLEGAESLDYQEPEMKQGADEEMTRQMLQRMIMMRGMPF